MKALGWIIGIVVIVVAGVVGYVLLNSGSIVKTAIEEFGPGYLGVAVQVNEVNLELTAGSVQRKGLSIGNPEGFSGPSMMKLAEMKVVLDPSEISETLVVLKQVLIDGAEIAAIANGQRTNFQQLMDNLQANAGASSETASAGEDESEMKFIIDRFEFTNAKVSLASDVLGNLDLVLPDIRLQDIGRKSNGATAAEVAEQILGPITAAISSAAVKQGLDIEGVKQNVESSIREKIGSGLRGLTDRFKK